MQKNGVFGEETKFIAFVTKGLEFITEREIKNKLPGAVIISTIDKRIIFSLKDANIRDVLRLMTVDDVHLLLSQHADTDVIIDEHYITKNLPIAAIDGARSFIQKFRKVKNTFSITVSKYKNDIVNLTALRLKLSEIMRSALSMEYTERDHANFDIRVSIETTSLVFSCRLGKLSSYARPYRKCKRKGSLKSPIAAALCMLVNPRERGKLVDNFCGSGTILCEGLLQGLEPYGGDIAEDSLLCARLNLGSIPNSSIKNVRLLDAESSKWPSKYFDYAISNYPWGKQVTLNSIIKLYSRSIAEYARILKKDGSIVLLGTKPELLVKHVRANFPAHSIISFRIGFLGQTPWVIFATPRIKSPT